jgi:hypothetical protein
MLIKKVMKKNGRIWIGNREVSKRELRRMSKSGHLRTLVYDERLDELEWTEAPDWWLISKYGISNATPIYYTREFLDRKVFQKLPVTQVLAPLAVNVCYIDD